MRREALALVGAAAAWSRRGRGCGAAGRGSPPPRPPVPRAGRGRLHRRRRHASPRLALQPHRRARAALEHRRCAASAAPPRRRVAVDACGIRCQQLAHVRPGPRARAAAHRPGPRRSPAPGGTPAPGARPASRFGWEKYRTLTSPRVRSRKAVTALDSYATTIGRPREQRLQRRGPGGDDARRRQAASALLRLAVEDVNLWCGGGLRNFPRERLTSGLRGHRRDEAAVRVVRGDAGAPRRRRVRPGASTSPMRLPGSSATMRRPPARPSAARAAARSTSSGIWSASGCPTNTRLHAVPRVELGLERQQAQHEVAGGADGAHPSRPPGPHLRAHVLHGADAGAPSGAAPAAD